MGKNSTSASAGGYPGMRNGLAKAAFALVLGIAVYLPASGATPGEKQVHKTAQQYIKQFRSGVEFNKAEPVASLLVGGRLDKSTLGMLAKELAQGTEPVRENVVALLEQLGLALDSPRDDKFRIIRDHGIMRVLLVEGFAKPDAARNAAASALRHRCLPSDLAAFNDIYVKSLAQHKGDYVYLAAKAKTIQARTSVDELAKLPEFKENPDILEIVRLAQAALGNTAVEDEYINAVADAHKNAPPAPKNRYYDEGPALDGSAVAARLETMGLIGTRRSLLVACSYLRSPLKSYVPEVSEASIRTAALDAIRYNYPDERVLFEPRSVAEWRAAEQFCTQHIGAVFDGPTPDIPPPQIFPTRTQ